MEQKDARNYLAAGVIAGTALAIAALLALGHYRDPDGAPPEPAELSRVEAPPAEEPPGDRDQGDAAKEQKQASSEVPPERIVGELVRTWNGGNAEQIAGLFATDGTLVIPSGKQIQTRDEIKRTISEQRAGVLKETTLTNTVDQVSRPDPQTAVVQGTYKLDGINLLGFTTTASGSYILRQVKRDDGRWLIAKAEVKKGDG
jgi:uncharacterized protein (TIGR02246 family)